MSSPPTFLVACIEEISGTLNVAIINPIKANNNIATIPTMFNLKIVESLPLLQLFLL